MENKNQSVVRPLLAFLRTVRVAFYYLVWASTSDLDGKFYVDDYNFGAILLFFCSHWESRGLDPARRLCAHRSAKGAMPTISG